MRRAVGRGRSAAAATAARDMTGWRGAKALITSRPRAIASTKSGPRSRRATIVLPPLLPRTVRVSAWRTQRASWVGAGLCGRRVSAARSWGDPLLTAAPGSGKASDQAAVTGSRTLVRQRGREIALISADSGGSYDDGSGPGSGTAAGFPQRHRAHHGRRAPDPGRRRRPGHRGAVRGGRPEPAGA